MDTDQSPRGLLKQHAEYAREEAARLLSRADELDEDAANLRSRANDHILEAIGYESAVSVLEASSA